MATIEARNGLVTWINTISVRPEDQRRLIDAMQETVEEVASKMPGFVSISLHASDDGGRVVNYSQWETHEDLERFHRDPDFLEHQRQYAHLMLDAGPTTYSVAYSTGG